MPWILESSANTTKRRETLSNKNSKPALQQEIGSYLVLYVSAEAECCILSMQLFLQGSDWASGIILYLDYHVRYEELWFSEGAEKSLLPSRFLNQTLALHNNDIK